MQLFIYYKRTGYVSAIKKKESHYITQNPAVKEKEKIHVYSYIEKIQYRER